MRKDSDATPKSSGSYVTPKIFTPKKKKSSKKLRNKKLGEVDDDSFSQVINFLEAPCSILEEESEKCSD